MIENFRFAFRGIWGHKMRSFLTMLGVIIGIASIIAIVSTIKGTNEQIMQSLIGAGNNNVTVTLKQGGDTYWMDNGLPDGVPPMSDDQKERIRELDGAEDASFYYSRSYVYGIKAGEETINSASILGVDSHYLTTAGYKVYQGRNFADSDYEKNRKVLLLDKVSQRSLFPTGDALGQTVEIQGEPFTVIGLIKRDPEPTLNIQSITDYDLYQQNSQGLLLLPDACWPILFSFDEPENCAVRAATIDGMKTIGKDTEAIMNEAVTNQNDVKYQADDLLEKAENKQALSQSTNMLLLWVASIALLVGGIGVMNIMLVSVTERTSEIGLKKALGARKRTIRAQFLTESAMLTGIGGILGVIAGIILALVISKTTGTAVAISIPAIILGVAFSMVIGIVFGLLPASRASNLNPIDALRRE
ncbi:MAG: ABC transporter permease [Eubacterium sp.]|nr:ABC transporter permease [Eubacterium sp.]